MSAGETTAVGPTSRSLWRRWRVVALVLVVFLLVAVVVAVAGTRSVGGRLDPRAADRDGGRALAVLVGERGVEVARVTDPAAAASDVDSRTIVFVPFPNLLSGETRRQLGELAFGTVVVVGPLAASLNELTDDVTAAGGRLGDAVAPDCSNPAAQAAGVALAGGELYRSTTGDVCYPRPDDEDERERGALATGRTYGGARLVVLGTGEPFTNEQLGEDGNAALGINLLGGDGSADELRWLVPSPGSAVGQEGGGALSSILPGWVWPATLQLLLAGVLLALWRGRRLGPPVTEPLPVVVRAAEAVEGRARLYRRADARPEAAAALRAGALARLVPRLGLDPGAGGDPEPQAVVAAVAARSGRPDAEVHATLFGPPPTDDAGLVRLSETLDSMVRSTLDPEVPHP